MLLFLERMLGEPSKLLHRLQILRILRRCTISRVVGLQFEFAICQSWLSLFHQDEEGGEDQNVDENLYESVYE